MAGLAAEPTELIDAASGVVAGRARRSVWGVPVWEGVSSPLGFAGQVYDGESGLLYNRFRFYDPVAASYTAPDPLGVGANLYSASGYVHNPVTWVDPLGLKRCPGQWARDNINDLRVRHQYNSEVRSIHKDALGRLKNGEPSNVVARDVVDARNQAKVTMRGKMASGTPERLASIEARNIEKYGNPIGPKYSDLARPDRDIIDSAGRTSSYLIVLKIIMGK